MKLQKCVNRDRKIQKRKNGMRISGASVKIIQQELKKKAEAAKKEREEKESNINKLLEGWIEYE
jgi:hypothetical protein